MSEAFKVGDEVIVWWRGYEKIAERIDKVKAVHKTGRFVLDGDPAEQWRPDGTQTERSSIRGATRYVVHATEAERRKMVRSTLMADVEAAVNRYQPRNYTTERLEKLLELLEPDVDPHP